MTKKKTDEEEVRTVETVQGETAKTEPVKTEPAKTEPARAEQKRPDNNRSGFYCYIGPNLKNLLQAGTVFRGTREEAYARAAEAIAAHPRVKSLIVSGDSLPSARIKVKTPGNALYANYRKLAGKDGK